MIEPMLTLEAEHFPYRCHTCGTVKGPFVNTQAEMEPGQTLYVCVETCLPVWARLAGWFAPDEKLVLEERLGEAVAENVALEAALAAARADKVVPLADVLRNFQQTTGAMTQVRCSATRKDGERCSAAALPGRDVCVAHARATASV